MLPVLLARETGQIVLRAQRTIAKQVWSTACPGTTIPSGSRLVMQAPSRLALQNTGRQEASVQIINVQDMYDFWLMMTALIPISLSEMSAASWSNPSGVHM